jgi:YcaO-like protein with predicted kinase domain
MTASATWARLQGLLPALGITRVGMLTGLDTLGLPVAAAYRPRSRTYIVSQGKGLTAMDARVGAVMESVETWSAEQMVCDLKGGSYDDLRRRVPCVDPATLPLCPGKQALPPDVPTIWCAAQDLATAQPIWVPYALVHTQYTPSGHLGASRWAETTRGLAAGNDRTECLSHGVNELIEGHANACLRELSDEDFGARRVDLDTVDDPACRTAIEACQRARVDLLVLDSTTAIGIPSFQALLLDQDDQPWRVVAAVKGMGAHPERGRALYRALSEAAQARAALIAGSREDRPLASYQVSQEPQTRERLREMCKGAARPFQAAPTRTGRDALEDASIALVALHRAGYPQVLTVDCTRDPQLPVLRVIVPGLRPEPRH